MSFCTAITCMDGRVQLPVNAYLRKRFATDFVDTITEPGANGMLAAATQTTTIESIFLRTDISVHRHGSQAIAVVGHWDCAGNPEDKTVQTRQTLSGVTKLRERYPAIQVIGLWVDEQWNVSEVEPAAYP
jgi:hypothetical protein